MHSNLEISAFEISVPGYPDRQGVRGLAQNLVDKLAIERPDVKGHCERVANLAEKISQSLQLNADLIRVVKLAGALHDLGKLNVPEEILQKPVPLSPEEFRSIREIPLHSATLARLIGLPAVVQRAITERHERPDGLGYPYGLHDEHISLLAKIVAVADTYDSLTHHQPYRPACDVREAIGIIRSKCVTHFAPLVVDTLTRLSLPPKSGPNSLF